MLESGLECNSSTKIATEEECRQYADTIGISFLQQGINHAPWGCYWHHNIRYSGDQITNIGFNPDLNDDGSDWNGVGRVCKSDGLLKTLSQVAH